ncbi:hypothetical protein OSB04_028275 [Centaurea solstitialis]|uniref:Retrovirus-related Pol polyprotein from transposon TNT 1-94 n=1 Tax=Centaurea solstitialis TaxID=347529 RepID=A0AA38SF80_9ASTR|nr:hypothetical protein OSB04_028275 [Centaurea solstitialis]
MTDCSPIKTPMPTGNLLGPDLAGKSVDQKIYRSMIGSLLYLTATRPDIMFATCFCARFQANSKESHLAAVKRILRYLKGTPKMGLWYPKDSSFELISFTDSNYGGCKLDRKSTSGSCQFLGDKLVSWTSKKQNCVSTSTAEAEYVAAVSCCSQVLWMKTQLLDYGYKLKRVPIYCDSESAIAITSNPVQHSKTKHIDIRYHFIKDNVEKGNIEMFFVQTDYQLADLFTKPLDEKHFNFLVSKLGMLNTLGRWFRNVKSKRRLQDMTRDGEIVGCKIGLYPRSQVGAQGEDKGKVKVVKENLNLELHPPSSEEVITLLDDIGYRWPEKEGVILTKTSATVHKTGLNASFYYIWNTFGLCLTGKTGSTEQFPTVIQNMVYSALKNRKFDYVRHIWDDIVKKIKAPKRQSNVPYTRFFSAVLELHMKSAYPTEGTFNNYAIGPKILDQVPPRPDDVPLSAVLVLPEPEQDTKEQLASPPSQGMFSFISSKPSSSLSMHAMSVANPLLTSPPATSSQALLKRPHPSGSTPPPLPKRAKSKAQKKKKQGAAGKKYYLTLPAIFNRSSLLSKSSLPADTPAPQQHEPEVVHLEPSENVDGNRSDAVQTSGNIIKQTITISSSMKAFESSSAHLATVCTGSFGAATQGHPQLQQDDPFDEFVFTDSERQLSAAELRRQSAERQLQDARAALQLQEEAHNARLQALELELASAKVAAASAEAQAAAAVAAATPPPSAVHLSIPCLDTIQDKVAQLTTSSTTLHDSLQDLKASALPAINTAVTSSSNSLITFQSEVVKRLDAQEAGLRAL